MKPILSILDVWYVRPSFWEGCYRLSCPVIISVSKFNLSTNVPKEINVNALAMG